MKLLITILINLIIVNCYNVANAMDYPTHFIPPAFSASDSQPALFLLRSSYNKRQYIPKYIDKTTSQVLILIGYIHNSHANIVTFVATYLEINYHLKRYHKESNYLEVYVSPHSTQHFINAFNTFVK